MNAQDYIAGTDVVGAVLEPVREARKALQIRFTDIPAMVKANSPKGSEAAAGLVQRFAPQFIEDKAYSEMSKEMAKEFAKKGVSADFRIVDVSPPAKSSRDIVTGIGVGAIGAGVLLYGLVQAVKLIRR